MDDQPQSHSPAMPATILVVDDASSIVKLCKVWLEEVGFAVLEADGSAEALKTLTQHDGRIDLLLTDLVLSPPSFQLASQANPFPHVNGDELATRAVQIQAGLRVVLMSGNQPHVLAHQKNTRETLPFLTKPFTRDNLISIVQDVLTQPAPTLNDIGHKNAAPDVDWFG